MRTVLRCLPLGIALLIMLVYLALASRVDMVPYVGAQGTPTPTKVPTTNCALAPSLKEGFESGTLGKFASSVATCVPGGCGWSAASDAASAGSFAAFSPDRNNITDQRLSLINPVPIPSAGVSSAYLSFWHRYTFESASSTNYDGGVLEYSTDGGGVWSDAASLITTGGYNGTISSSFSNPLAGRPAWVQVSPLYPAFYQSTVNLVAFVGKNLLLRFRQADDSSIGSAGWWIDDVQISMNNCFHQELPLIKSNSSAAQAPSGSGDNPLTKFWQSVWEGVAGWAQPLSRTDVTP